MPLSVPHLHGDLSLTTQGTYRKADPTAHAAVQRTRKGGHRSPAQAQAASSGTPQEHAIHTPHGRWKPARTRR